MKEDGAVYLESEIGNPVEVCLHTRDVDAGMLRRLDRRPYLELELREHRGVGTAGCREEHEYGPHPFQALGVRCR